MPGITPKKTGEGLKDSNSLEAPAVLGGRHRRVRRDKDPGPLTWGTANLRVAMKTSRTSHLATHLPQLSAPTGTVGGQHPASGFLQGTRSPLPTQEPSKFHRGQTAGRACGQAPASRDRDAGWKGPSGGSGPHQGTSQGGSAARGPPGLPRPQRPPSPQCSPMVNGSRAPRRSSESGRQSAASDS